MEEKKKEEMLRGMFAGATFSNSVVVGVAESGSTVCYQGQPAKNEEREQKMNGLKQTLMEYVGRLMPVVADGYKESYADIWQEILAQDAVSSIIYKRGSQKGTVFNRNLVARISHMFVMNGIIAQGTSDLRMTEPLEPEKGKNHSVRGELALMPEDKLVKNAVKEVLEKHKG